MTPGATGTLLRRGSPLASTREQCRILSETPVPEFARLLADRGLPKLVSGAIEIFQVNVGKACNQTCAHCHVDAGPDRAEVMSRETAEACMRALAKSDIPRVDITGGAPELNPNFRWLVEESRRLGRHVIDRCNLTVLLQRGQEDLADFLAENSVEVIASLPYYQERETDRQRGHGVFQRSIEALRRLNELGYGKPGSGLVLNLVHNPVGAFLPASQASLEADFRRRLGSQHGVVFNGLFALANMPISRYLEFLLESGNYERYMERLVNAFNPATVQGLMCRNTISIGWDGRLHDCDFNQMLDLGLDPGVPGRIEEFDAALLAGRSIVTARHCYGCTAGSGSSCGGATVG